MRNLTLTKKLADEFCLFFIDMTYVPGQFFPYIFLAPCHKRLFSKMTAQKACGHYIFLTDEFKLYRVGISDDLITFGKNSLKTRWLSEDTLKR